MKTVLYLIGMALGLALILAAVVEGNRALADGLAIGVPVDIRWIVVAIVVVPPVYFIPSIVAAGKDHPQAPWIFAINAILGWTLVGWALAFAWSLTAPAARKPYMPLIRSVIRPAVAAPPALAPMTAEAAAQKIEELAALRYQNAITEADYLRSRSQILEQWQQAPLAVG